MGSSSTTPGALPAAAAPQALQHNTCSTHVVCACNRRAAADEQPDSPLVFMRTPGINISDNTCPDSSKRWVLDPCSACPSASWVASAGCCDLKYYRPSINLSRVISAVISAENLQCAHSSSVLHTYSAVQVQQLDGEHQPLHRTQDASHCFHEEHGSRG